MRNRTALTGVWRYLADPAVQGESLGFPAADFDVRCWGEVGVPFTFEVFGPEMAYYEGSVWLARDIDLPSIEKGSLYFLHFEAANTRARVWVNGSLAGSHVGGFLPFSFEVSSLLKSGRNRIAVCVDNRRQAGDVPGPALGWQPQGGLLREVSLERRAAVYIEDAGISALADGTFEVRVTLRNRTDAGMQIAAQLMLESENGETLLTIDEPPVSIEGGAAALIPLKGKVDSVQEWSPEMPALYRFMLQIGEPGKTVTDTLGLTSGFRSLSIQDGRICLNGTPVFLKGFNRHDDSPHSGLAADLVTAEADLRHMRSMGANFVRLCHYPHHPGVLDLCDRLGLMAMAEIPLYWWDGTETDSVLQQASGQLEALIRRDRHHPSVCIWSVSNETQESQSAVREGNRRLIRQVQALDPSRWAVHVSDKWGDHRGDFEADDVICVNHYPSFNGFLKDPKYTLDRSSADWAKALELLAERYPGKPLVVAEFGYTAWSGVRDGLLSEKRQAEVIEGEYRAICSVPQVCGALIWCYADHPWPDADFLNRVKISPYGVMTRARLEKFAVRSIPALFGLPTKTPAVVQSLDNASVFMIRPDLLNLPVVSFPEGYGVRSMTLDDAGLWEDIWRDTEPFLKIETGLFMREFGFDPDAVARRCFLITAPNGCAVGTISAWYDRDYRGQDYGRIHWVAVRPGYQGKGLAKAALGHALQVLAQWHDCAYLATSIGRRGAIMLYRKFGFIPDLDAPGGQEAWAHFDALGSRGAS